MLVVGARSARRPGSRGGGHRAPEAPLEHLREDGRAGQGVRRDLRPRRRSGSSSESEKDCWAALGVGARALAARCRGGSRTTSTRPKFNLYQSLHTTVVGREGKPLEIQIRTQEMHRRAEFGIAAHWGYKAQASAGGAAPSTEMAWLQRIVDWERDTPDPIEFLETLKLDLEQDEVYVFTPKGAIITLPAGATPVDFAYAIHTEVGHHCVGAQGQRPARPARLAAHVGDTVEIFTSKVADRRAVARLAADRRLPAGPQQDPPVVHPRAARGRDRERARGAGQGAPPRGAAGPEAQATRRRSSAVGGSMGYTDLDALYAAIGEGHVSARRSSSAWSASCAAASTRSSSRRRCAERPRPRHRRRRGRASTSRASTT